jgi:hypothetical protein
MAQRTVSSGGVTATLWAVVDDIDDDDEDILEVTIDVSNESTRDLWDIEGDIRAMDGTHAEPRGSPSRIESGGGDELKFWVPADTGAWLFKINYNTDSGPGSVELGPFTNEMRIAASPRPERQPASSSRSSTGVEVSGGDPLAAAFGTALDGFGEDEETNDPVLETDATSDDPMQAAFAGGLLASQQAPAPPTAAPAPAPTAPPAAPTGPPTAPPTGPPNAPSVAPSPEQFSTPSGPPTGPPPSGPPGRPPGPPPSAPTSKSGKPPGPPPS